LVAAAAFAAVFAFIAILYKTGVSDAFDSWAGGLFLAARSPAATAIFRASSVIGSAAPIIALCLILFIISATRKDYGVKVSLAAACSQTLNFLLKLLFARPRPDGLPLVEVSGFSFPSGHAMNNACVCVTLALLVIRGAGGKRAAAIICLSAVYITFIGAGRVYLGVHYATDVVAGFSAGAAVALAVGAVWPD